jgi:hypothetical protein
MANPRHVSGWSVSADGRDVRHFYNQPSHHTWQDDTTILEGRSLRIFKDDGSGKCVKKHARQAARQLKHRQRQNQQAELGLNDTQLTLPPWAFGIFCIVFPDLTSRILISPLSQH